MLQQISNPFQRPEKSTLDQIRVACGCSKVYYFKLRHTPKKRENILSIEKKKQEKETKEKVRCGKKKHIENNNKKKILCNKGKQSLWIENWEKNKSAIEE